MQVFMDKIDTKFYQFAMGALFSKRPKDYLIDLKYNGYVRSRIYFVITGYLRKNGVIFSDDLIMFLAKTLWAGKYWKPMSDASSIIVDNKFMIKKVSNSIYIPDYAHVSYTWISKRMVQSYLFEAGAVHHFWITLFPISRKGNKYSLRMRGTHSERPIVKVTVNNVLGRCDISKINGISTSFEIKKDEFYALYIGLVSAGDYVRMIKW